MTSQSYPEDHPLHGRSAGWITAHAVDAMRAIDAHTPTMSAVYSSADLLALVHELKRMASESERDKAGGREMHRQLKAASDEAEDRRQWLTRAIEISGAPEGSDWAGLLARMSALDWDGVRKLRERAEAADTKTAELEAELEILNIRRKSAEDHRKQAQEDSAEFSNELRNVIRLLDEQPARGSLIGPGIEDGVAHLVNKRLVRDAARIDELEAIAETKLFNAQQQIEVRDDRIKELESAADRIAKERDMHAKTAALLGAGPLRPVSSPNPDPHLAELQRIAAALEKSARAHEAATRMSIAMVKALGSKEDENA